MSAPATQRARPVVARTPLAAAGTFTLVTEYKRKLKGYPLWKQLILDWTRAWLRFCDLKLDLPTIVHHDKGGSFTIDYCGGFDSRELADAAISKMQAEREAEGNNSSQFEWNDLPRNGVTPEASGRYGDSGFTGDDAVKFERANRVVRCPFNGSRCNPDDTVERTEIVRIVARSTQAVEAARNLKQSLT